MSDCIECDKRARYMAADPEMYRGEDTSCAPHREIVYLRAQLADAEVKVERLKEEMALIPTFENPPRYDRLESEAVDTYPTENCHATTQAEPDDE